MNSIGKNSIHWTYPVALLFAIIALQQQKATAATLSKRLELCDRFLQRRRDRAPNRRRGI